MFTKVVTAALIVLAVTLISFAAVATYNAGGIPKADITIR